MGEICYVLTTGLITVHDLHSAFCSSYNTAPNKMETTRLVNRIAFQNLVIPK